MRRRALLSTNGMTNGPDVPSEPVIDINNYLTIKTLDSSSSIYFNGNDCEYCINGDGNWKILKSGEWLYILGYGKYISFRAELTPTSSGIGQFVIYEGCMLLGNCNSLLFKDDANSYDTIPAYSYHRLFEECWGIVEVSKNFLPATTLAANCYSYMFRGCGQLTTAPELPATTLASSCYMGMFYDCTSLTTAPALPATTLVNTCYASMFRDCYKLNYIKMLATDISATNCLVSWVYDVSSTGTFVKNPDATWEVYGNSGIPNGWTVKFDGEEDEGIYDDIFGELPPESTSFEFPLYLNITELDYEDADYKEYIRNIDDDIIVQLTNWFDANYRVHNSYDGSWEYINLDESHQIYINGSLITQLKRQPWTTAIECFPAPSPFTECFAELGFLYGIVYK